MIHLSCWSRRPLLLAAISLVVFGCNKPKAPDDTTAVKTPTKPLRVLVLDDEELAAKVEREWESRAGSSRVTSKTSEEVLASESKRLDADVVIYPSGLLGELAERKLIVPLAEEGLRDQTFDRADLFDLPRLRETAWGRETVAVPFGSPQLTLLYRKDIFTHLNLTPPTTWKEYGALLSRLSDRAALGDLAPPADEPWHATSEPIAEGWAGYLLLARAAAYVRHPSQYSTIFDYKTMEPLIAGPPFTRALEELVAASKHGPASLSPTEARRLFLAGHAAMALTWPSRSDDASPETPSDREDWIGVAELPGAREVYQVRSESWQPVEGEEVSRATLIGIAGRLGSVTRECRRDKQASGMLFLLAGEELGALVSSESKRTAPFRVTHLGGESMWVDRALEGEAARLYGEVLEAAQSRSAWVAAIRIPGRAKYVAALDAAIAKALADDAPADALGQAAARWNEITEELGREQQRVAYARSLGLNP